MTPVKIDINNFVKTGEGANGSSYDSKANPDIMVKLYNEGYDLSSIYQELDVAVKVYELGIPSPKPGQLVTDGKRVGILFNRIKGKRSFSRALADEPQRVEEYSREFARYCKYFHSIQCPVDAVPDAKESFLRLLDAEKHLDSSEKAIIENYIKNRVPECTTALHGDMHFGNILTTLPAGAPMTQPHDIYFIDLGYFSYGYPLFDLGMTWNICNLADKDFVEHDMHFKVETGRKAWEYFCDEYFFGPEKLAEKFFGPGATADDVTRGIIPFVIIKLLLVEFNVGFMPENYLPFIKKNLALLV